MEVYEVLGPGGESMGQVTGEEMGLYRLFSYIWEGEAPPSRLVIRGSEGEAVIGVPVPEAGRLRLKRRIAKKRLDVGEVQGFFLTPIVKEQTENVENSVEIVQKSEEKPTRLERHWRPEPNPEELVSGEELKESLEGVQGALVSRIDDDTFLALRYTPGGVFPMMPAFRYGVSAVIGGRTYIVFRIRDGEPV